MNTSTSLLIDIVHRQLTFLGHILRKGELENLVVTGFVNGKRDRGRKRETFLTYLSKIVDKPPLDLINLAKKRDVWTKFCAHSNLRLRIWYTMMMMITEMGHQTDTACAWLVCHSQEGLFKLYPPYPASTEALAPVFWKASHATPHHGWRSASSLWETLGPIQDQNQH